MSHNFVDRVLNACGDAVSGEAVFDAPPLLHLGGAGIEDRCKREAAVVPPFALAAEALVAKCFQHL